MKAAGRIITVLLLGFVAASAGVLIVQEFQRPPATSESQPLIPNQVIAYYFHGNKRCPSCRKIEEFTKEEVERTFSSELMNQKLAWRLLNYEDLENEPAVKKYRVYTSTVVLSKIRRGKEVEWKNLEEVWNLLEDQEEFSHFIRKEVGSFLNLRKGD